MALYLQQATRIPKAAQVTTPVQGAKD